MHCVIGLCLFKIMEYLRCCIEEHFSLNVQAICRAGLCVAGLWSQGPVPGTGAWGFWDRSRKNSAAIGPDRYRALIYSKLKLMIAQYKVSEILPDREDKGARSS